MSLTEKPLVDLIAFSQSSTYHGLGPEELAVIGALGCFEHDSSIKIWRNQLEKMTIAERKRKVETILRETSGRGHGSVLDQPHFTFSIDGIPRLATLELCSPEYLMHLQQSLRRVTAEAGFYIPKPIIEHGFEELVKGAFTKSLESYNKLLNEEKIKAEDARFVLPLLTRTKIQTTGNARELMHLHSMSRKDYMPSAIRDTVENMMDELREVAPRLFKERETNYEQLAWFPSPQIFAPLNKTMTDLVLITGRKKTSYLGKHTIPISLQAIENGVEERYEAELANLKHMHFTYLSPMSIATLHQAIRQRTWNQSVEPIYHAVERGEFVTPPAVKKNRNARLTFDKANDLLLSLYHQMVSKGVPQQEAIGVVPHALKVYDLIHINGWNALHSIGKRRCKEAQWEIRDIATDISDKVREEVPELGKYSMPQGIIYGRCPERKSCGLCSHKD